ncbi:MAG: hypothetical protein M8467_04150 [Anaerolineae bacterium]|nr:hypothetical protein [Anaerolineae bacterium]
MAGRTTTVDRLLDMSQRLSPSDQLRLICLLSDRLRHELAPDEEPVDILTTVGLGAEVWRSVDVATYLAEERASWEP